MADNKEIKKEQKKEVIQKHIPLKDKYNNDIVGILKKKLKFDNVMAVPKVEKIVINVGAGKVKDDNSLLDEIVSFVGQITGQSPVVTRAKKSVSNFKLREGMPVGVKVTLRQDKMWFFLDKLINITLPRTKDFRGVKRNSFDGNGNYSLGIEDQSIFPEIDTTKNIRLHGLQISIITNAKSDSDAEALLEELGMPFKKNNKNNI